MLAAFIHTDTAKRMLPYYACPERAGIITRYKYAVSGPNAAMEIKEPCARLQRTVSIADLAAVAIYDDVLILGGWRVFTKAYFRLTKLYWLRSAVEFHSCPSLVPFDIHHWEVASVTRGPTGILTELNILP